MLQAKERDADAAVGNLRFERIASIVRTACVSPQAMQGMHDESIWEGIPCTGFIS